MLVPERRRRSDLVVAAIIVTVASLVLGLIWLGSDARGTTSVTAQTPLPPAQAASTVPASLSELWRAHSPATSTPVVAGGAVVAADGGSVAGFDPATGSRAWEYSRDRSLCDIVGAWDSAVAVYRDERGCAQVTELNGSTGAREKQRTSDADAAIELSEDGTYVTSRGDTRLEVWRSDLVRTLEYGRVDAPVNPDGQPRSGCTLLSSASNSSRRSRKLSRGRCGQADHAPSRTRGSAGTGGVRLDYRDRADRRRRTDSRCGCPGHSG